jgi:hypothetical protein
MLKEFYRLNYDTNYSPTNAIEEIFIKLIDLILWIILIAIGIYTYQVLRQDSILAYYSFGTTFADKTLALLLIIPFVYFISLIVGPLALLIGIYHEVKKYNIGIEKIYIEIQEMQKKIK